MAALKVDSGLTMAILSVLSDYPGDPLTTRDMVETISSAGKGVTVQEVSSLMVSILKSKVKELLEIGSLGRVHTYRLRPEYHGATAEQLQKVYLKRVQYTPADLYRDLHGVYPKVTPEVTPKVSPEVILEEESVGTATAGTAIAGIDTAGTANIKTENEGKEPDIIVHVKHKLTIILDGKDVELTIKYS